jgi:DNA polymerase I-like protein with 3'-5' exonuclease and polymerase domains
MNFQNIPRSDKVVKAAFVPKLDAFLFFDYKQIEPRLLAFYLHAIGDTKLADLLNQGVDTYTAIVRGIYRKDDLTDEERQTGKVLFLSLMYGGGIGTVMRQFSVGAPEAKRMVEDFHSAWPGVRLLQAHIEARISKRGYITTLYGRHLHPESPHKAINALIQGCAADIMRHALIRVWNGLNNPNGVFVGTGTRWTGPDDSLPAHVSISRPYASHMVSVIHDEIIIDTEKGEIPLLVERVPQWMDCEQVSKVVPIYVDVEISRSTWADKEPYREESLV